jgi:hypothetical protein
MGKGKPCSRMYGCVEGFWGEVLKADEVTGLFKSMIRNP